MHPIGFSTGSFYKIGTIKALDILQDSPFCSIEISLGEEFLDLKDYVLNRDLSKYNNISFHIPKYKRMRKEVGEEELVEMLIPFKNKGWNMVLHPDEINDFSLWEQFGSQICIENMESCKSTGKTVGDMKKVFNKLPNASMCFDIGHVKQMDITMEIGKRMCSEFYDRIKIIHFSDVAPNCKHLTISRSLLELFSPVMEMVPKDSTIIFEYTPTGSVESEVNFIKNNFSKYGIDTQIGG